MVFKYIYYFLFIFFFFPLSLISQETNYWFHQTGATSALKGGIESAGVNKASAIFYNPGALSFIDEDILEGQLDVISIDIVSIENAGGENVDLFFLTSDVTPAMFTYLKKSKRNTKITFAFGILSRVNINNSFILNYENVGEYILPINDKEIFQGQYRYENKIKENWFVGAISYKLNKIVGIGLSTNVSLRIQDYIKSYDARAFPEDELGLPQYTNIASTNQLQSLDYRGLGVIFKPGININLDKLKFGLVVTTPNINIGLLNSRSSKSQLSILPDESQPIINKLNSHSFYNGVYKTPLSINLGVEYYFDKTSIALATEWFSKIDTYEMIKRKGFSEDLEYPTAIDPKYATPVMANKSIVNIGVSVTHKFNKFITYLGSFRTDFNYFDDEALDRNTDFVPNLSFWDAYHLTSGLIINRKIMDLTLGVNYGFNKSKNNVQYVNMTTASQSNFLLGNLNNNTKTQFHNISFTIGINFNLK